MVVSELAARLNCAEYKNWVKAGHCLLLLRSCLQGFIDREVLSFHRGLLAAVPGLGPHATCRGGSRCSPRARQFQPQCQVCAEWKHEILRHHINRNGDVHWGNCKPGLWPKDPWEVAKLVFRQFDTPGLKPPGKEGIQIKKTPPQDQLGREPTAVTSFLTEP
eukprot:XP_011245797.1 PREDICTED: uncharacterized protein CXorf38 homolog isoform X2 [Mus musculus]